MPTLKKPRRRNSTREIDPTRTVTLRKAFETAIIKRMNLLKRDITRLIVTQDVLGLKNVRNVYCPTGEGGGIDPTCSPGGVGKGTWGGVQKWHREHLVAQANGLSDSDKLTVREYQESGLYDPLNNYLRTGKLEPTEDMKEMADDLFQGGFDEDSQGWADQWIKDMDNVLSQTQLATELTVYRGVDEHVYSDVKKGDVIEDLGYMSTSADRSVAEGFSAEHGDKGPGVLLKIIAPWGSNALYADPITDLGQHEVIFARGSRMTVTAIRREGGRKVIHATMERPTANVANAGRWEGQPADRQLQSFEAWMTRQTNLRIVGVTQEQITDNFWEQYIQQGWRQGAGRSFDDVNELGVGAGAKDQFLRQIWQQPVTREKVEFLASRVFTELKGFSASMSHQVSRRLADGLVQGLSPNELARSLHEVVGISVNRAKMIARTEIVRAHGQGQLDAMRAMGVEEVGVNAELKTMEDACPICKAAAGPDDDPHVYTIDEAEGLIPFHPNCRCGWEATRREVTNYRRNRISNFYKKPRLSKSYIKNAEEDMALSDDVKDLTSEVRNLISALTPLVQNNCGTGAGGFQPGNTCAKGSGAFSSMPIAKATSKEAKAWRKKAQAQYDSDPQFRAAVDAITLYTQGDYKVQRAFLERDITGDLPEHYHDSSLPDWVDQPMHGNPMANYKTYFEGQEWLKPDEGGEIPHATYTEAARALNQAIRDADPVDVPMFRGTVGGNAVKSAEDMKIGDDFNILGTSSFTLDQEIGDQFSRGIAKGQGRARDEDEFGVLIEVRPGARAIPVTAFSPWDQKEVITTGNFKVVEVNVNRDRYGHAVRVHAVIEQVSIPESATSFVEREGWRPTQNADMNESDLVKLLLDAERPFSAEDSVDNNCGTGAGGFQPGNTCAKGGGITSQILEEFISKADVPSAAKAYAQTLSGGSVTVKASQYYIAKGEEGLREYIDSKGGPLFSKDELPLRQSMGQADSRGVATEFMSSVAAAKVLVDEIRSAPFETQDLYRAVVASPGVAHYEPLKPGDDFSLDRITSFSSSRSDAAFYGQKGETNYEIRIRGLVQSIATDEHTGMGHAERITLGNFRVVDVTKGERVRLPEAYVGRTTYSKTIWIEQVTSAETENVFCPTGEGGGIDPTCSPGGVSKLQDFNERITAGVKGLNQSHVDYLGSKGVSLTVAGNLKSIRPDLSGKTPRGYFNGTWDEVNGFYSTTTKEVTLIDTGQHQDIIPVVAHEFGHAVDHVLGGGGSYMWSSLPTFKDVYDEEANALVESSGSWMKKDGYSLQGDAADLSYYIQPEQNGFGVFVASDAGASEAFAECYAASQTDQGGLRSDAMRRWFPRSIAVVQAAMERLK